MSAKSRYGDTYTSHSGDDRGARRRGDAPTRSDYSRRCQPSNGTRHVPAPRSRSPVRDRGHHTTDFKSRNYSNAPISQRGSSPVGRRRSRSSGRYDGYVGRQRSPRRSSPETRRRSPPRRPSSRSYSSDRYASSSDYTDSSRSRSYSSVSSYSSYSSDSRYSMKNNRRGRGGSQGRDDYDDRRPNPRSNRGDTPADKPIHDVNSKEDASKQGGAIAPHPSNTGSAPRVPGDFRCHICKGSGHWTRSCTFLTSPQAAALLTSSSNHRFAKIDRHRGCWECGINDGHPFFRCTNKMFLCKSCGDMHTTEDCPHEYKSIEYHEFFDDEKGHCYFERIGGDDEIDFCIDEHGIPVPRWYAKLALKEMALTHTTLPKNNADNRDKGDKKNETTLGVKNDKHKADESSQNPATASSVASGTFTKDSSTNHLEVPLTAKEAHTRNGGKGNRDNGRGRRDRGDRYRGPCVNVSLVFRCPYDNHVLSYEEVSMERSAYAEKLRELKRKEAILSAPILPPFGAHTSTYIAPLLPPSGPPPPYVELPPVLGRTIPVTTLPPIIECNSTLKVPVLPAVIVRDDKKKSQVNEITDGNKKTGEIKEEIKNTEVENGSIIKCPDKDGIDNSKDTNTLNEITTSISPTEHNSVENCHNDGTKGEGEQPDAHCPNNTTTAEAPPSAVLSKPPNPRITWYIRAHALDVVLWHCDTCRVLLPRTVNECVLCHRERPHNMSEKLRKERDEKRRIDQANHPNETGGGVDESTSTSVKDETHEGQDISKNDDCAEGKHMEEVTDTVEEVSVGGKRPREKEIKLPTTIEICHSPYNV